MTEVPTARERAAWRAEAERQTEAPAVERILDRRILRLLDALEEGPEGTMVTEWGVFRDDTGEQVGTGATERRGLAEGDLRGWADFNVTLKRRTVTPWVEVSDD